MVIGGYSIGGYWQLLIGIILVVIGDYFFNGYSIIGFILMAIGGYYIGWYWRLLIGITLVIINGYSINGYWWIFWYCILVVINDY
jgi:hypothetical protein